MTQEALEAQLTKTLLENCDAAEALGCRMVRMRKQIEEHGAAALIRELARRGRTSDGFDELATQGRLDLTAEAVAVQSRFGELFSDAEVNACFATLLAAGYQGWR